MPPTPTVGSGIFAQIRRPQTLAETAARNAGRNRKIAAFSSERWLKRAQRLAETLARKAGRKAAAWGGRAARRRRAKSEGKAAAPPWQDRA